MDNFREWFSDNLRYFLLALIIILIIGAAVLGISIYSKVANVGETETVKQTETVEAMESESETEEDTETEAPTEAETEATTEVETEAPTEAETEAPTEVPTEAETEALAVAETEAPVVVETEAPTEAQPVYLTMQGSCYLRAEPSTESEILGTYWAGTTVEFLEDVGGWYKVRVDGMTGYMGARFF